VQCVDVDMEIDTGILGGNYPLARKKQSGLRDIDCRISLRFIRARFAGKATGAGFFKALSNWRVRNFRIFY